MRRLFSLLLACWAGMVAVPAAAIADDAAPAKGPISINWYHDQEYFQPVIDAFTAETGIPVRVTSDYDIFTTDVITVSDYKGLLEAKHFTHLDKLEPAFVAEMNKIVPAKWRDIDGRWFGMALRFRTAIVNKNKVPRTEYPKSILDLADPKWKDRMTQRASSNVYNRSTLAYIIARYGEDKARAWAKGIAANVAKGGYLNDVKEALAVSEGKYDIGFMNTYYLGYLRDWYPDDKAMQERLDKNLEVVWLDADHGLFANVTGISLSTNLTNGTERYRQAEQLVAFILSAKGQALMSKHVHKYPVRSDVQPATDLRKLGTFKVDDFNVNDLRYHYDLADRIMAESGWESEW